MKLLVIEDEPDLLKAVAQALREAGYSVDTAANGLQGLSMAQGTLYDGVVLDLMMPHMDGWTLLERLRQSKTTPVLIVSARDATSDRINGLEAGADDYLIKPFEIGELVARVRAMVRRGGGGAIRVAGLGEISPQTVAQTFSRMATARRVQMGLTPPSPPNVPGVDLAFHYQPAQWIGGDYCDIWTAGDGRLAFAVADVAGKGMPAAMVMANLQASLRAGAAFRQGAAQAVEYVNDHLSRHLPDEMFVTLFLGMLDAPSGRLEYVNAGHVPPLLSVSGGQVCSLGPPENTVLGLGVNSFCSNVRQLTAAACLLIVTDGVTESRSADGDFFGAEKLIGLLRDSAGASSDEVVRQVVSSTSAYRDPGATQDDLTVLALRWLGLG